jgi:transposase, IS5 family
VIRMRREQRTFGDGLIEDEIKGLSEEWMIHADRVLEDEQLIAIVFEELGKRHPKSKSRGREGTPAETVMRLMILKHIRNWGYVTLEREVRTNLVPGRRGCYHTRPPQIRTRRFPPSNVARHI